jgi:hypothetical protein
MPAPRLQLRFGALVAAALLGCGQPTRPASIPSDAGAPDQVPRAQAPAAFAVAIAPDEVLRRLSAFLYRGDLDDGLRALASGKDLSTSTGVAALAREMLRDPRAARGLDAFVVHWLELEDLAGMPKSSPRWSPALAADMVAEVHRFVAHVVLEDDGRLETLLTAPSAFVNERLAPIYGMTGVTGDQLRLVEHDGRLRLGVLGLPGVIARRSRETRTFPSRRGHYAAGRVVCKKVFISNLMDPENDQETMRQTQDHITAGPSCSPCHHLMNPPGWAFERFDAIGAERDNDIGLPVDASGLLTYDLVDATRSVPFDGLPDLARAFAQSPRAAPCHAYYWLTFAVPGLTAGTTAFEKSPVIDEPHEVPGLVGVIAAFEASGHDIRALIAAVASSPPFLAP